MKLILNLFVILAISITSSAQMAGWSYIKPILIQENSATTLVNYQLEIHLNTQEFVSNGEMMADGSDIRFSANCDGSTLFNYWIENGMNSTDTKIWVKIDTLQASALKTIYMHYGNSMASAISSVQGTFIGPHSSTDSVANGGAGGVGNSQRGFRFSPNEDILVTSFGKMEPTGTTRYVTLFDFSSQAIISQTQVVGPAGQYSYGSINSPVWLTASTQYLLELYQDVSDGYYFGSSSQIGQHLTYLDMRYCNNCNQNTFPTNTLSNYHYGYPDLWYFTKNTASIPPSYQFNSHTIVFPSDSLEVCFNDSLQLSVSVSGGEAPYTYAWTNVSINDSTSSSPIIYPSLSMYYYLTIADGCGVSETDSIYITVKPLPSFAVDPVPSVICEGESSELMASFGDYTYNWSDGTTNYITIVYPDTTTLYSVVVTDNVSLCSNIGYAEVIVNVPVMTTNSVNLCAGETYAIGNHIYDQSGTYIDTISGVTNCDSIVTTNLTIQDTIDVTIQQIDYELNVPSGADNYQWINCTTGVAINGETSSTYQVTQNGTYQCEVTTNGCSALSDCVTILDLSSGVILTTQDFNIFPNPARDEVNLFSSVNQEVVLIDAVGNELKRIQLKANETVLISVNEFSSGIYFVKHGELMSTLVIR